MCVLNKGVYILLKNNRAFILSKSLKARLKNVYLFATVAMILPEDFFTKSEFKERIKRLQCNLKEQNIDIAIIQYKSDLYYYSGTGQACILVVPVEDEPILFVRRLLERAKEEAKIDRIVPIKRTKELYSRLKEEGISLNGITIGFEGDVIPFDIFEKFKNTFPDCSFVSIGRTLRMIRSVKSKNEIEVLKQSAKILDKAHEAIPDIIKEGMTEIEAAGRIYAFMRSLGGQAFVRSRDFYTEAGGNGMVLSGKNSGIGSYTLTASAGPGLHHSNPFGPSKKKIAQNEPILVDLSVSYNGYITDETRCYVIGQLQEEVLERYRLQTELEERISAMLRKGKNTIEIYEESYEIAKELGIAKALMLGGEIPFLAHGVGLELNDLPVITKSFHYTLQEGNVIALEPKLIYPNEMTLGTENTYAITSGAPLRLTNAPEPLIE